VSDRSSAPRRRFPPPRSNVVAMRVVVAGWEGCLYFERACAVLARAAGVELRVVRHEDRDAFVSWWEARRAALGPHAAEHATSPAVWLGDGQFVGGYTEALVWLRRRADAADAAAAARDAA
jgi:glutaredoxin